MPYSNTLRLPRPKSNKFRFRPTRLFTSDMGKLIPNFCELVYPGDVWKLGSTSKSYFQSMIGTTMGAFRVYQFYHYVPLRLLMKNFEPYITGGLDGNDATPTPVVTSPVTGWKAGSLFDHLGYVSNYFDESNNEVVVPNFTANAWALRAYAKVINDWFINENLDMEVSLSLEDGLDTTTNTDIFNVCWRPDYFTNALPWAQRGPAVTIPLGETAPVYGTGGVLGLKDVTSGVVSGAHLLSTTTASGSGIRVALGNPALGRSGDELGVVSKNDGAGSGLYSDISSVSGIEVNKLRDYIAMQVSAEVLAQSGARLIEYLLGIWGVRSSDKTLQRSQYLGGGVAPVYISEVAQTSSSDETTPQGNLSSNGIAVNTAWGFKHRFEEFGVLLGTQVILPDVMYFQGNRRWMNYNSRWDYPNPLFARLGDQPIEEKEIFAQGAGKSTVVGGVTVDDNTKFGFVPRYDEGRYIPSTVHGDFKTSLKYLHAARQFSNPPLLNSDFAKANPSKRIFAVTTQKYDAIKTEIGFDITCYRKLPKHQLPATFGLLYGV